MALVKYGGGIIQMSGSIAGNTYARNRYGNYARAKTMPINPESPLQQTVRSTIAQIVARWSDTVTALQRSAWNTYADNVSMKNRLAETIHLSGFNHYVRCNALLVRAGFTRVDAAPVVFELPEMDPTLAITASETTQVVSVAYDDTAAWCDLDDAYMYLFLGAPQNPQRNFFAGPWKAMTPIEGDSGAPPTTPEAAASSFVLVEGQRLWMYARIQLPDGRLSEPFRADTFCAA